MEATRFVLKIKSHAIPTQASSSIGADALVDPSCKIMEKSSVKLSSVGSDGFIGSKSRIAGSILLNNVHVDDDVILENCIVGPHARIGKKSKLTNCYVEGNYIVDMKGVFKGETLSRLILDDDEFGSEAAYSSDESGDYDEEESDEDSDEEEYYEDEDFEDDGLFER